MKKLGLLILFLLFFNINTAFTQTTINFDNASNWIQDGSILFTSYGNHGYGESGVTISGTNVLRNTTTAQDGFPGALGTYSIRIRDAVGAKILITIPNGGVSNFSIGVRRWDASPIPNYSVRYSTNGGSSWTNLTNIDGTLLTSSNWFTYNGTINQTGSVLIEIANTGNTERIMVDNFTWNGFTSNLPTLTTIPSSLTGFNYIFGSGPSVAQSYILSGTDLDGSDVTVTAPTNYEISLDNSSFTNFLTLSTYDGSNTTVYVRLVAGLPVNAYNGEVVANAGGGATTSNVTCSGEVTPVLPDVVITEVNDHPTFEYEYVEIFNNGSSSVNLTGWKLLQLNGTQTTTLVDDVTNVLEGSLILAPGGYAIIFRGEATDFADFKSTYNITETINAYTNNKSSNNSGSPVLNGSETLRLEDNFGNLIDYFGDYQGGSSPVFSVSAGDLYERREYPNNGTLSNHWYTLTASSLGGSPAEPNENPLPVELTSFSAAVIGKDVKLSWNTATEINNFGFEIERSVISNGVRNLNWEKIGFVNGNGNSNSPKSYSFVDDKVSAGKYSYRLKQIDNDGQYEYSKTIEVDVNGVKEYKLTQNYPNPFNPTTTIQYILPQAGNVNLTLYNILGQEIRTLVNEMKEAGTHTINIDASDLNSGMYIYKIESGSFVQTRKMTLVK